MKLFNKVLCLVALCAISSVSAKKMYTGGTEETAYTGEGAPTKKPAGEPLNKYVQTWRTRSGLQNRTDRVIFTTEILSIQKYVQDEQLSPAIFQFLLQVIRDAQFKFTGNDAKDLVILKDSDDQINYLVSKLGNIDYTAYTQYLNSNVKAYENRLNAA